MRRSSRVIMPAAVLSIVSLVFAAVPALAANPDPSTTTVPTTTGPPTTTAPEDTTTTTVPEETTTTTVPEDTTTTTVPEETTTTAVPEDTTTTTVPEDPAEEGSDFSPDEPIVPHPAFARLTGFQSAVLQDLQTANDDLATRLFALVGMAHDLATAKDQLKAARVRENAAVKREVFGVLGAALYRNDATVEALSVLDTADAKDLARAVSPAQSDVAVPDGKLAVLDAFTRRLESERKNATRERAQAQAGVAALNARVFDQTKAVNDATAARDEAASAVTSAFGSGAGMRPGSDGITAALDSAQAGQTDPPVLAGFAMPIPGARLGSPYGIRIDPFGGGAGMHPGLDFDANFGTPIQAAATGVVIMAGDCGGYGYCVVIDHGSSLATVYAHQSQLLSKVGDFVLAGQVIGLVGSTGRSTGPHLHFELRLHGIPIDALPTLTA